MLGCEYEVLARGACFQFYVRTIQFLSTFVRFRILLGVFLVFFVQYNQFYLLITRVLLHYQPSILYKLILLDIVLVDAL